MERDRQAREDAHKKLGYKEGASQGREEGMQKGAEVGFAEGMEEGIRYGEARGAAKALRAFSESIPQALLSQLKEHLSGLEAGGKRAVASQLCARRLRSKPESLDESAYGPAEPMQSSLSSAEHVLSAEAIDASVTAVTTAIRDVGAPSSPLSSRAT